MNIALENCKGLEWKDCTEEKLLYYERRLDEKNPIACLSDNN